MQKIVQNSKRRWGSVYIKDGILFRIFTVELTTKEPIFHSNALYTDITALLKQQVNAKVPITFDNERNYSGSEGMHYRFDIHVGSQITPEKVRLNKVEDALLAILAKHQVYKSIKISIN